MTDQELEQRLRNWYRAEIGEDEPAPVTLRTSVTTIPAREWRAIRLPWTNTTMRRSFRFAVAAFIAVIAVGGALYALKPSQPPVGGPGPTLGGSPTPAASAGARPGAGSWTATGAMINGREGYLATRLLDGRVLVAGGTATGCCSALNAAAELYDPVSSTWTATGSLITARGSHSGYTATLLLDGRVLVTGGGPYGRGDTAAEVYDPATGSWTAVGHMIQARDGHTATRLPDGRVLVVGGSDSGVTLASAELFDPATGSWTATSAMHADRSDHTAAILPNGKVLVAGGFADVPVVGSNNGTLTLDSAELYDPATGSWAVTGAMTTPRQGQLATVLPDGGVLALGGYGDTNGVTGAELYDPAAGSWTAIPSTMADLRGASTATLLPGGRVLVTVGFGNIGSPNVAVLYDPADGSWSAAPPMIAARLAYAATLLLDGTVLVAGGSADVVVNGNDVFRTLASAERYYPAIRP